MEMPRPHDLAIIADLEKSIDRMLAIVGDLGPYDMVRDTLGDSRPETVLSMKAKIDRKREDRRYIMRQFPEYFSL